MRQQNWILWSDQTRDGLLEAVRTLDIAEPVAVEIKLHQPTRSQEQNRKMWACLGEISAQVNWHGNYLTAEEWKDVLTASLKKQRAVPGIDGGFVILGTSTRKMTVAEMTELIELTLAFGAQHDVKFTEAA